MNRRLTHLYAALLAGACATGAAAQAVSDRPPAAETASPSSSQIDDKSAEVLGKLNDYLAGQKSFQVDAEQITTFANEEATPEIRAQYRLSVRRPNLLALTPAENTDNPSIVCDGAQLYVSVPGLRKYTRSPAPANMDAILTSATLGALATTGRPLTWLAALAHSEPRKLILQDVTAVRYLGQDAVDGRLCQRLGLTQPSLDWQLWVSTGERPVPLQIMLDLAMPQPTATQAEGGKQPAPAGRANTKSLHAVLRLKAWTFDTPISAEVFRFTPPALASEVSSLVGPAAVSTAPASGYRAAPKFEAELLGGGHFQLAERLGQNPIVLSFFVTWRRSSLDTLGALTAMQGSTEVPAWNAYLVNVEEPAVMVRSYLDRHRIVLPVILDNEGGIAATYGVSRTPCTVLIDADGNIAGLYEAVSANELRDKLTRDLVRLKEHREPSPAATNRAEKVSADQ